MKFGSVYTPSTWATGPSVPSTPTQATAAQKLSSWPGAPVAALSFCAAVAWVGHVAASAGDVQRVGPRVVEPLTE